MADLGATLRKLKPHLLMVFLQFGFSGIHIISVATLKKGMSHYVLVVYRNLVAAATMAPFAIWFERETRPRISILVFLKILAMAFLEVVLDQNLYYMGTKLTSASFASAIIKIPAIPYVMALVLRIEKVNLRKKHHQAIIIGNVVTVVGAVVMILYKGPVIKVISYVARSHMDTAVAHDWVKGALILLASAVCCSSFIFLQDNTLNEYPANLSLTTMVCFVGVLMSIIVALVMDCRNATAWALGWDTRLLAAVYSGIVCTGIAYYVQGVVMKERDPVFVTAFQPLCMIIVVFLGSAILAEVITLGRMLGVIIIVIGLYFVIWGKGKDHVAQNSDVFVEDPSLEPEINTEDRTSASIGDAVDMEIPPVENTRNGDSSFVSRDFTSVGDTPEIGNK